MPYQSLELAITKLSIRTVKLGIDKASPFITSESDIFSQDFEDAPVNERSNRSIFLSAFGGSIAVMYTTSVATRHLSHRFVFPGEDTDKNVHYIRFAFNEEGVLPTSPENRDLLGLEKISADSGASFELAMTGYRLFMLGRSLEASETSLVNCPAWEVGVLPLIVDPAWNQ